MSTDQLVVECCRPPDRIQSKRSEERNVPVVKRTMKGTLTRYGHGMKTNLRACLFQRLHPILNAWGCVLQRASYASCLIIDFSPLLLNVFQQLFIFISSLSFSLWLVTSSSVSPSAVFSFRLFLPLSLSVYQSVCINIDLSIPIQGCLFFFPFSLLNDYISWDWNNSNHMTFLISTTVNKITSIFAIQSKHY